MLKQVLLIYYNFEYNVSYMKNEELFSEHTYINIYLFAGLFIFSSCSIEKYLDLFKLDNLKDNSLAQRQHKFSRRND